MVRLTIGEGAVLPDVCARCGGPATTRVEVDHARDKPEGGWLTRVFSLLGLLTFGLIFGSAAEPRDQRASSTRSSPSTIRASATGSICEPSSSAV